MAKIAAIDIGTNSMRLLLCEVKNRRIVSKSKELITTRIGHNVDKSGMLSEKAIIRNVEALKYFKNKAENYGAEKVIAIATSSVRDAVNKEDFISLAEKETQIQVAVIDGKQEAEIGIAGVMSEIEDESRKALVVDIGGGSTELILGTKSEIKYCVSINAGAVRMTERYVKSSPMLYSEQEQLKSSLEELFREAFSVLKNEKVDDIIFIGGTATTAAAIYHGLEVYKPEIVHNTKLKINFIKEIFEKLSSMTLSERYSVKGLQKERADIIPAGIYIMKYIMEALNIEIAIISENDNLEGTVVKFCL